MTFKRQCCFIPFLSGAKKLLKKWLPCEDTEIKIIHINAKYDAKSSNNPNCFMSVS